MPGRTGSYVGGTEVFQERKMKKELEVVVESVHSESRGLDLNLALQLSSCMAFSKLVNYLALYPNQRSEDNNNRIYFTRLL